MIIFAAFLFAVPQQQETPAAAPTPVAKTHKERRICRSVQKTGSFIPDSVCHTPDEWKQIDQTSGVDAHDMQRMQSQMSPH